VKRRWLLLVIGANLLALLALVFVYPHLMVSPGPLVPAHHDLDRDCFACHSPWRGVDSQRCIRCHTMSDIGLRTTQGIALPQRAFKTSFHQELTEQSCLDCHSDHAGLKLTDGNSKPFSHSLLRAAIRDQCQSCHEPPADRIHRNLSMSCGQCHTSEHWKPAAFDHSKLAKAVLEACEGCHQAPTDSLHRQIRGACGQCHSPQRWKPATFDHDKFFVLDGAHNASCSTCHTTADYSRYTCYGCHEHQPDRIRAEHLEEGIRDFTNCVQCHRSARGESERGGGREERD